MKEINIAATLVTKRKEKGMTQDELAGYIGVSKASVSKWETGQSYPDITFLPRLAAYFNISIDELMGYSPQMTKEDIRKLYHRLASQFATAPFDEVMTESREIIKKYYSCFPLLLQMAILLMNHHMFAVDQEQREEILREAANLCVRVKTESDDVWLSEDAVFMESTCYLFLQEPQSVLDLLGETIRMNIAEKAALISQAYQLMGNVAKASEATQISMYQHLMALFNSMLNYMQLSLNDLNKAEEILNRALSLAKLYHMENLNPNMLAMLYAIGAQVYCVNGQSEKAIGMLDQYVNVCTKHFFPYSLHGDSFFDSIDALLSDLDLGGEAPRSEKVIKDSMLQDVLMNPAFANLAEEPGFKNVVQKLKYFVGGAS